MRVRARLALCVVVAACLVPAAAAASVSLGAYGAYRRFIVPPSR